MKIKTYQTDSVPKALEQIKKELGPNAIILDTQKTKDRGFLGLTGRIKYTITAASEPSPPENTTPSKRPDTYESANTPIMPLRQPNQPGRRDGELRHKTRTSESAPAANSNFNPARLASEIRKLSSDVRDLKLALNSWNIPGLLPFQAPLAHDYLNETTGGGGPDAGESDRIRTKMVSAEIQRLRGQGLDENIIASLINLASRDLKPGEDLKTQLRQRLNSALLEMIQIAPIETSQGLSRGAVFLGPPGVGKTTTIAKLAAILALKEQVRVQLITLDTYRIAAAEQLKTYAEIIGVPVRVVSSVTELEATFSQCDERDHILIDTIGHSHNRVSDFSELAAYLTGNASIEKHLVLSATTRPDVLRETTLSFAAYMPDKLLFTKLDESSTFGTIANELVRTGKPLSYLTNGQRVPEDLLVPTPASVGELLLPLN